jgi:hypothetical protein
MTNVKNGAAKRLEEVNAVLNKMNTCASIEVRDDLETGSEGEKISTVILNTRTGQQFAIYASGSSIGLNTYLRGLHHGLCMVAGGYQFKALNDKAWELPRSSILRSPLLLDNFLPPLPPLVGRRQYRLDARTSPRFAFQRSKYTRT